MPVVTTTSNYRTVIQGPDWECQYKEGSKWDTIMRSKITNSLEAWSLFCGYYYLKGKIEKQIKFQKTQGVRSEASVWYEYDKTEIHIDRTSMKLFPAIRIVKNKP